MITDTKLRYLVEAAALGSMRAASDKLDVAVSSVSRQIAQLESELGLLLIERGRRSIKLTEAGELALQYYRESVAHREVLDSSFQALRGLRGGKIQLAIGEGFVSALSSLLQTFVTKNAGVLLSVTIASTLEVIRHVADDEAHIGLVFHAPADPRLSVRSSIPQPIKLIVHPAHPLAAASSVTLKQLADHCLCMPEVGFRIRQIVSMAETQERVSLSPRIAANSLQLLREMVKSGDYVTLLPESAVITELESGELVSIPVASSALQSTSVNVVCRLGRALPVAPAALLPLLESALKTRLRRSVERKATGVNDVRKQLRPEAAPATLVMHR
jgi:DNA-binding transcriptional LysR family regulator